MSLRKFGSEAEIIDHRTDNGDYGLVMKSNNEDKTFQDVVSDFGIYHPEIHSKLKSPTVSRPDVLSGFVDYHPYILSKRKSGLDNDIIYDGIFSGPAPPFEEFGFKLKMDETRSPSQDVLYHPNILSKRKSGTVNDITIEGIFPGPGQKPRHCGACGGEHDFWFCPLRWTCKFDQKVGEDYEIVCHCSKLRCSGPCPSLVGRVRMKKMPEF